MIFRRIMFIGSHIPLFLLSAGCCSSDREESFGQEQREETVVYEPLVIEKAHSPGPPDRVNFGGTWATLSWTPGAGAVSHDVYLSDNFEDVNDGTGDAFRGNQSETRFIIGFKGFTYPDGLVSGAAESDVGKKEKSKGKKK